MSLDEYFFFELKKKNICIDDLNFFKLGNQIYQTKNNIYIIFIKHVFRKAIQQNGSNAAILNTATFI
ncbi:hypothetical protein BpHYR1_002771 [Brachionus plicatilis]|uniref:Uncharacterized protein n=1 Tax=Brachionus plicatilis TaxID=10195 RepID=A0A3M7SZV4_BRAPC|nr:hypothetical protein BpHYR1_002771 [Brachionus plicatilis]